MKPTYGWGLLVFNGDLLVYWGLLVFIGVYWRFIQNDLPSGNQTWQ